MKVCIIGAAGYIGKRIISCIIKNPKNKEIEIIAVVRNKSQISEFEGGLYKVIECDIGKINKEIIEGIGYIDILIYLAWGRLQDYNSLSHIEIELKIHYNFISQIIKFGVGSIVVMGTCFEYGNLLGELHEDDRVNPITTYAFAKNPLRKQLQFLQKKFDFNMTWMRIFYIHGGHQQNNSLYRQLLTSVQKKNEFFNMSMGEQIRDYLHVDDASELIVDVALRNDNYGIVNICSGEPISIRRLVEGWIKKGEYNIELNLGHYQCPDYEPIAFWGSRAKLDTITSLE